MGKPDQDDNDPRLEEGFYLKATQAAFRATFNVKSGRVEILAETTSATKQQLFDERSAPAGRR